MVSVALSKQELISKVNMLDKLRDKALLCFLYITGCRIQEVVKFRTKVCFDCNTKVKSIKRDKVWYKDHCKKCKKDNVKTKYVNYAPPIANAQIEYREGMMVISNVRCLKRKKQLVRNIPVSIEDDKFFIKIIDQYIAGLTMSDYIFKLSSSGAWRMLKKVGIHPHMLRHARLTHLVTEYGFTDQELKLFVAWTDSRPADIYVHLNWQHLADRMSRNRLVRWKDEVKQDDVEKGIKKE